MTTNKESFVLPNGAEVDFYPETHTYVVNGRVVPSVTTLLSTVYGNAYAAVNEELLKRAAEYGTAVHEDIEQWIKVRAANPDAVIISPYPEVNNFFDFVEPVYHITPIATEKVVVLYGEDGHALAAGRFDLLCKVGDDLTLVDFKTTSTIHKQLVTAQLNLYLRAAIQSGYISKMGANLGVVHLSGEKSRYIPILRLRDNFYVSFFNEVEEKNQKSS